MSIYMINSFEYIIKAPIAIVIYPKVSGITLFSTTKHVTLYKKNPL